VLAPHRDLARAAPQAYIERMVPPASSPEKSDCARCPTCRRPAVKTYRPFCSQRCKDVDLNRWLSGIYAVPAVEAEDEELDGEPPAFKAPPPES
jgi:endogenous inhibitor of DNA gyrase (YacG/DUF329 family)